jgi:putative phosphoribosyl transferase
MNRSGLATLLFDLLTEEEERAERITRHLRFDIDLLAHRLTAAVDWVSSEAATRPIPLGLFGASTGAASALVAAATRPEVVRAVVSRGGRPDLAGKYLRLVRAPTLLLVGGEDRAVIQLNREAMDALRADKRLVVVPGATHLFEEPGALDEVARVAAEWLRDRFSQSSRDGDVAA